MSFAIVPAPALGDGILGMVLAHNARRAGRDVFVLHRALVELRAWYPWARIEAPPANGLGAACEADALFVGDPARADDAASFAGPCLVFGKQHWHRDAPYLESLRAACAPAFDLPGWDDGPGLVAPTPRTVVARRVVLHPTSANPAKDWSPGRWQRLAQLLAARGWDPVFLVAPEQETRWRALAGDVPVAVPGALGAVAAWLQDAAGCIATDSGIGHLASALGVPTLAVFRKASAARFWAPAWPPVGTVAPCWRLPGGGGHRFWRAFLRPARVLAAFEALAARA